MVKPAKITREQLAAGSYVVWNEFVQLLAFAKWEELTPVQRPAFLAFWYEHEVQNGGHYQYFQNRGIGELDELIPALRAISAHSHADVAAQAQELIALGPPKVAHTVEEFVDGAREGTFDDLDAAFHECSPTIVEALEAYLREHEGDFVEYVS